MSFLSRPWSACLAGAAVAASILCFWLVGARIDTLSLVSFLARFVHISAAMLWVGMIWFVNFIQLAALASSGDEGRKVLMRHVVPQVATVYRGASHAVLASGLVLLLTNGYILDRWVFPSAVYIPTLRSVMLWGGVLAGIVMWALVQLVIWPALGIVLDPHSDPAAQSDARARLRTAAGANLFLAVPVTFVMVAAAHLY